MTLAPPPKEITYPESDGNPIAENTLQFEWIALLHHGFSAMYADDPQVWVASDVLWYPVKGDNQARYAPDLLIVFGRPKHHRGSYKQWEEGGIAPYLVVAVLSPGNSMREMGRKFEFYERHGVHEYYIYNPDTFDFSVWIRGDDRLRVPDYDTSFVSPRTGVRFVTLPGEPLQVFHRNGERFKSYLEVLAERQEARAEAEAERSRADHEKARADELAARLAELQARLDALNNGTGGVS
jgi:Uma2 family endonuclease